MNRPTPNSHSDCQAFRAWLESWCAGDETPLAAELTAHVETCVDCGRHEVERRADEFADGALDPAAHERMASLIDRDEECRKHVRVTEWSKKLVSTRAERTSVPADLSSRVRASLEGAAADPSPASANVTPLPPRRRAGGWLGLAALALLGLSVWGFFQFGVGDNAALVHAAVVEESLHKVREWDESDPQAEGLARYLREEFDVQLAPSNLEHLKLLSWSKQTFGENEVPGVGIKLLFEGREIHAFALAGAVVPGPKDKEAGGKAVDVAGKKTCLCKHHDGEVVICYKVPDVETLHMILVLDEAIEEMLEQKQPNLREVICAAD